MAFLNGLAIAADIPSDQRRNAPFSARGGQPPAQGRHRGHRVLAARGRGRVPAVCGGPGAGGGRYAVLVRGTGMALCRGDGRLSEEIG